MKTLKLRPLPPHDASWMEQCLDDLRLKMAQTNLRECPSDAPNRLPASE